MYCTNTIPDTPACDLVCPLRRTMIVTACPQEVMRCLLIDGYVVGDTIRQK